eukprot:scaffold162913_cov36-Tisochrysis_lutea.AAC.1
MQMREAWLCRLVQHLASICFTHLPSTAVPLANPFERDARGCSSTMQRAPSVTGASSRRAREPSKAHCRVPCTAPRTRQPLHHPFGAWWQPPQTPPAAGARLAARGARCRRRARSQRVRFPRGHTARAHARSSPRAPRAAARRPRAARRPSAGPRSPSFPSLEALL